MATDFASDRRALLKAAAITIMMPTPLLAASATPPVADSFIRAINGSAEDRHTWLALHMSPAGLKRQPLEEAARLLDGISLRSGGLSLLDVAAEPGRLLLKVKSSKGGKVRTAQLRPDRDDASKLYGLPDMATPMSYARRLIEVPVSRSKLREAILHRIRFAAIHDEFSGAVRVVAPDGETLVDAAFGFADQEAGERNSIEHRFNLGSADKSFTAILVGRLVEQGRLSFDARVIDILPEYANRAAAEKVTVRHLLTHSAGLGDLWSRPGFSRDTDYARVSDIVPSFWDAAPFFEPGSRYAYSNEGYVLLGAIIEKVTGRDWWSELAEHIYAPAGMRRSAHFLNTDSAPLRAIGYKLQLGDVLALEDRVADRSRVAGHSGNSCGGGYSTVADMTAYLRALREGRLMSREMTEQMTMAVPHGLEVTGLGVREKYGMGFTFNRFHDRTIRGHGGGGPFSGIDGRSGIVWETGWAYSILGNYDSPYAAAVALDIAYMLASQD